MSNSIPHSIATKLLTGTNRRSVKPTEMAVIVLDLAVATTKWIVQKRGFHFESLGLSIRDVAMDAVAELLTEDGDEMPIIQHLRDR